jgi:uncharacterized integral membrane protein
MSSSDLRPPQAGPADAAPAQRDGIGAVRNLRRGPPQTRSTGAVVGYGLAGVLLLGLIVFVAQNTAGTRVTFLGLTGSLPLAAALLAAAFAGAVLTLAVTMTRTTRLRRQARRD